MKSRMKSMMLACVALTSVFFANCTDDALMEASENYAGRPFELTVQQPSNGSRLALGNDGLTTEWEPGDQLVLVNKAGGKAPIYLTCTLSENASSAKFASESGVPSGDYYVIYNYNEKMVYDYKRFQTIEQINEKDELVLWANLNIPENTYSANVDLQHLYAKIRVELINMPESKPWNGYQIGVYSSKKGFPMYRLFTNTGIVDAEYGPDPNSMYSYNYTYFESSRKYHNIYFGQYKGVEVTVRDEEHGMSYTTYDWEQAKGLSALILPADLSNEDIFFYVLDDNYTCYEIKKEGGVNFKAGTNYTVQLDLSTATKTTLTESQSSDGYNYHQISNVEQWRHAVYRNGGSYEITADIDFDDEYFFPINAYRLNGNNKKLSNINLDWSAENNVGLIKMDAGNSGMGTVAGNELVNIQNLTLENVTFKGKNEVGALGGKNVLANKCSVIGTSVISGEDYVGGMVGRNEYYSYASIEMVDLRVGQECTISGKNYVGGILGRYMNGNNDWQFYLNSSRTLLKSCKSEAIVTATGDYVGGIFGKIGGNRSDSNSSIGVNNYEEKYTLSVEKCINEGAVTGVNYVGGIGGDFAVNCHDNTIEDRVVLKESYSEGNVSGVQKVAGILGATRAAVNTCYSIGEISASASEVGGIVGRIEGDGMTGNARIANSYSLATLTVGNNGHIGGIVGNAGGGLYGGSTIINCYYAADPDTYEFGGIVGNSVGYCKVTNCVTTLASLGLNLGNHQINTGADYDGNGYPDHDWNNDGVWDNNDIWTNAADIITNSKISVPSILAELSVINADEKYSTNVWSGYFWNCVKFASFEVDTDSDDFDDETVTP